MFWRQHSRILWCHKYFYPHNIKKYLSAVCEEIIFYPWSLLKCSGKCLKHSKCSWDRAVTSRWIRAARGGSGHVHRAASRSARLSALLAQTVMAGSHTAAALMGGKVCREDPWKRTSGCGQTHTFTICTVFSRQIKITLNFLTVGCFIFGASASCKKENSDDAKGGLTNGQNCFGIWEKKKKKSPFHFCLWQWSRFAAWLPPSAAEPVDTEPGQFAGQSEEKRETIKTTETTFHECYLTSTIVLVCWTWQITSSW